MTMPIISAVVSLLVAAGFYIWIESSPEYPALINGCEDKEVKEMVGCSDDGCVYSFTDTSLDIQPKGLKSGDIVNVCRGDKHINRD